MERISVHESSSVNARRRCACFLVLGLGFSTLCSIAPGQHPGTQLRSDDDEEAQQFPLLGLPIEFGPQSIMSFNVRSESGRALFSPRLAVLNFVPSARKQRIRIFKVEHGKFVVEFSLDLDDSPVLWEKIGSFPSGDSLPGIVIWGGSEVSHNVAKVVVYVGGKFQVVFDKAYDMELVDLDFDGFPEIISGDVPTSDAGSPTMFQVWAWAGEKYVPVAHVPIDQVFSPDVIRAVKAVKRTRPEKAIVPSRPEGLKR